MRTLGIAAALLLGMIYSALAFEEADSCVQNTNIVAHSEGLRLIKTHCNKESVVEVAKRADAALSKTLTDWLMNIDNVRLYTYRLSLANVSNERIELLLHGSWYVHSPYMSLGDGFSTFVDACSTTTLEFISPWEPMLDVVDVEQFTRQPRRQVGHVARVKVPVPSGIPAHLYDKIVGKVPYYYSAGIKTEKLAVEDVRGKPTCIAQ